MIFPINRPVTKPTAPQMAARKMIYLVLFWLNWDVKDLILEKGPLFPITGVTTSQNFISQF